MSAAQLYFDDLAIGQTDRFGAYRVFREEVIDFASKYDPQSFHIDDAAAAANPVFGRLCASAVHTLAMTSRMLADRSHMTGFLPAAGLGMEEMKVLKPVYPDDTLSVVTEIVQTRRSKSQPDSGIVTLRVQTFNQHGELVLEFRTPFLFKMRAAQTTA